jgi:serine/threonine protein kinase
MDPLGQSGPPEIDPEEIEIQKKIGEGSYGSVYKGRCRGKDVAIIILHYPITDKIALAEFKKEVTIMRYFHFIQRIRCVENRNLPSDSTSLICTLFFR